VSRAGTGSVYDFGRLIDPNLELGGIGRVDVDYFAAHPVGLPSAGLLAPQRLDTDLNLGD
jgi:hypothetical protein